MTYVILGSSFVIMMRSRDSVGDINDYSDDVYTITLTDNSGVA